MSSKAAPPPAGVEFPADAEGNRSTMGVNQEAFAVSVGAADPAATTKVRGERKWRSKYAGHVVEQVAVCGRSAEKALAVANAGLKFLHDTMVFIRDGSTVPLSQAMFSLTTGSFQTVTVKGSAVADPKAFELEVPYQGKVLRGDALKIQVDKWVRSGVIELSTGAALTQVVDTKKWLDLRGKVFVLLGASSAMGPVGALLSLGATVVAVDIDRPGVWRRLLQLTRQSCGTMVAPARQPVPADASDDVLVERLGCNLLTETPEIRNWLLQVEKGKPMVIGCYAYLDGALFVKVSVAMDAIVKGVMEKRSDVGVAYLCTPSDAHVIPAAAREHSVGNLRRAPLWHQFCAFLRARGLRKNAGKPYQDDSGAEFFVVDAIVPEQGPNYILAKRLQHWRAVVARAGGAIASSNIAPSTSTVSVVHNKMFALAYSGMKYFPPMEVFQQETSSAVMMALLVYDVQNDRSSAQPGAALANPMNLFTETPFHGGVWRCAYKFGSLGTSSALLGLLVNMVVPGYLAAYNAVQLAGWGTVLARCVQRLVQGPSVGSLWSLMGSTLTTFQSLALLEGVHSALGMVSSPLMTTAIQLFSRLLLVQAIAYAPEVQPDSNTFLWCLSLAWSITEVVRYSFYALSSLKMSVPFLTYLRYTLFIVLYPLGVMGEMGCLYHGASTFAKLTGKGSPPVLVRYYLHYVMRVPMGYWLLIVPAYVLGLPMLYGHMLSQRKKVLGGSAGGGKAKRN
eukprot:RCo037856